jgi:hypothetical protein
MFRAGIILYTHIYISLYNLEEQSNTNVYFDWILEQGKASLLSTEGMTQLQYLIFVLASFHCVSSILTFGLGMAKVNFTFYFHDYLFFIR